MEEKNKSILSQQLSRLPEHKAPDHVWDKISDQLIQKPKRGLSSRQIIWMVAASVSLLLLSSFFFFQKSLVPTVPIVMQEQQTNANASLDAIKQSYPQAPLLSLQQVAIYLDTVSVVKDDSLRAYKDRWQQLRPSTSEPFAEPQTQFLSQVKVYLARHLIQ